MILFFAHLVLSTLKFGENPYKILGLPNTATKQDIKSAFRKLTLQYHPDLNKEKDTTAKWVNINDAFELLNDPDRKARYDRTGSVSEDPEPIQPKEDPFQDLREHFIKMRKVVHVVPKTPLLTVLNFEAFVSQPINKKRFSISYVDNEPEVESLIFIYSSVMCTACDVYLEIFEEFASQFDSYVKCGRIDVSTSSQLAKDIGAKGIPSFIYYKKNLTTDKVVTDFLTDRINSVSQISAFLITQWNLEIFMLTSIEQFYVFLNHYDKKIKIIEIVEYVTETSSIQFEKFAGKYKEKALFAIIEHKNFSIANQFDIQQFPAYLIFRNSEAKPLIYNSINSLTVAVENCQGPVMTELTRLNFPQICGRNCLIRIGKAPQDVIEDLNYQYFSTFWIDENSKAAKTLGAEPNDWVEIDFDKNQYTIIRQKGSNETETIRNSGSFNRYSHTHELPSNFNVDFQFEIFKLWLYLKIRSFIDKITFTMVDLMFTACFFGYIFYNKFIGWLEKRKANKAKYEKYHSKREKKARENDNDEKPLRPDDS